jgi:predicted DCC family thiol-disulfide oxidoreductase YuxK
MDDSLTDPDMPSSGGRVARPPTSGERDDTLSRLFGIDLRSLALLRVSLGAIILLDLFSRARYLTAHYTDRGVMPRDFLYTYLLQPAQWSFHLLSGSALWQILLFTLSGIFALAMIFGYRTRWAVFFCWLFAASLQYRNPMINNSGDQLLRVLLFWSIFLPLGAKFSIDAAVNNRETRIPDRIFNMASLALLMQVCIVYWFTAALKSHPIWRVDHTAVYYALSIEQFVTPLGKAIYAYPDLMKALTIFTLYLEILGPALAFLPIAIAPVRVIVILLFLLLHAGFGLSMRLGFFPWISAASWMIFLPTEFWEGLFARLRTPSRLGLKIYFDGDCGFCKRLILAFRTFLLLPETPLLPAQTDPSIHADMVQQHSWVVVDAAGRRHFKFEAFLATVRQSPVLFWLVPLLSLPPLAAMGRRFYEFVAANRHRTGPIVRFLAPRPLSIGLTKPGNIAVGALLGYVVLWNVRTLDYEKYGGFLPPATDPIGYATTLAQRWDMFAPYPWTDDGWYVITAQLHNGQTVDVFRDGRPLTWEKPAWVVDDYPSQRWRKYLMNLSRDTYQGLRRPYAQYLCWNWNRRHEYDRQLDGLDIYFMREITQRDFEVPPAEKRLLYGHHNIPEADAPSASPG